MNKDSPSWTMTSRKFYTHKETTPGPGTYSMTSTLNGPNFRIGLSQRISLTAKTENPGPGAYSPKKLLPFQGNTFMPSSLRSQSSSRSNTPGPGQYAYLTKPEGPSYSLRGRSREGIIENKPGPGCYNPLYNFSIEKAPAFSLGSAERNTSLASNGSPGPGNYEIKENMTGPNWGFGSGTRETSIDTSVPGPGSYPIKPKSSNISYSMVPRRAGQSKTTETPGPGTYNCLIKEGVQVYSLPKSQRKTLINEKFTPGPGAYSPELLKSNQRNVCNLSVDLAERPGCRWKVVN